MMLHLEKMHRVNWLNDLLIPQVNHFRSMIRDGPSDRMWEAKLNDQDIFNAALAVAPQYFRILSCEWNVQIHARINTMIHCAHHVFDGVDTGEYIKTIDGNNRQQSDLKQTVKEEDESRAEARVSNEMIAAASSSSSSSSSPSSLSLPPHETDPEFISIVKNPSYKTRNTALNDHYRTAADIPLNCDRSRRQKLFVCEQPAKVLHYMASAYALDNILGYYDNYWGKYRNMSWNEVLKV